MLFIPSVFTAAPHPWFNFWKERGICTHASDPRRFCVKNTQFQWKFMIVWIKQRGIHVHVSPNGNKTSTGKSIYTVIPAQNIWWFSATMSLGKGKKIEIVGCTTLTTGYTIIWKNVFKIHPICQDTLVSHKISVSCNYCKHFLKYQTDNQQVELFQKIGLS